MDPIERQNFQPIRILGKGGYGVVYLVRDRRDNKFYAVKRFKFKNTTAFSAPVDDGVPGQAFQVPNIQESVRNLRELRFLRLLNSHPNIVKIVDVLKPMPNSRYIYIVLERMQTDLFRFIQRVREKNEFSLSFQVIQTIMYQLFKGLDYLHAHGIIHRDVKSANVLISIKDMDITSPAFSPAHIEPENIVVKICDLGLARYAQLPEGDHDVRHFTNYVQTRAYRAPEMWGVFGTTSTKMDVWSVGCILGELLRGYPIFRSGQIDDLMMSTFGMIGIPGKHTIAKMSHPWMQQIWQGFCFNSDNILYVEDDISETQRRERFSMYCNLHLGRRIHEYELVYDLLSKIFVYNPDVRISAAQAMAHPFFFKQRRDDDVMIPPVPASIFRDAFKFESELFTNKERWTDFNAAFAIHKSMLMVYSLLTTEVLIHNVAKEIHHQQHQQQHHQDHQQQDHQHHSGFQPGAKMTHGLNYPAHLDVIMDRGQLVHCARQRSDPGINRFQDQNNNNDYLDSLPARASSSFSSQWSDQKALNAGLRELDLSHRARKMHNGTSGTSLQSVQSGQSGQSTTWGTSVASNMSASVSTHSHSLSQSLSQSHPHYDATNTSTTATTKMTTSCGCCLAGQSQHAPAPPAPPFIIMPQPQYMMALPFSVQSMQSMHPTEIIIPQPYH